ncbi:catalase-like domain-containing protein [Aspergillus cavernicola]|uniref:Catalase-like domain-containing protein n=1 Tax=Aspergillus cavernicola TaxID=176166 RepID=A0ABR4HG89_9EURO
MGGGRIPPAPEFKGYFTLPNGCPTENPLASERGDYSYHEKHRFASQLVQDTNTLDVISHLTQERIPERYVHAKGAGVFGKFELTRQTDPTQKISNWTDAKFLQDDAGPTRLFVRFSTIAGERGYPDTVRDAKGCAFKLYTDEGNLDWVFLNPDVFQIRDPAKFPSMAHATKRDPATNLPDPNMVHNPCSTMNAFFSSHPESFNSLLRIFSDQGTPQSFTRMDIFSVNTYTFTKATAPTFTYVRIKMEPEQGVAYFTLEEATTIAGKDPDYLGRRLYQEIQDAIDYEKDPNRDPDNPKPYPSWKVYAQIIDLNNIPTTDVNIFDPTKVIPDTLGFPWVEFGKITLNEVPANYFTQVEQAAFAPNNVVPGWDISPDPILQIRLFAYGSTQRYRLGVNLDQLPTNRPCSYVYNPTRRDGLNNVTNYANARNYLKNNETTKEVFSNQSFLNWTGSMIRFESTPTDIDYSQPRDYYQHILDPEGQDHLVSNIVASLSVATITVRNQSLDPGLAQRIRQALATRDGQNKPLASYPGVVVGGEKDGKYYVPPTVPDPATGVVKDVFKHIQ